MMTPNALEQAGQTMGTTRVFQEEGLSVTATMFKHSVHQKFRSEQENRPIYEDVDMISISATGQPHSIASRKLREEDKTRFPELWEAYVKGVETATDGTPIEDWAEIPRGRRNELKAMGVTTIEAMAGINDSNLSGLGMDARHLKEAAAKYLEAQTIDVEELNDLKIQNADLDAKVKDLTSQNNQMLEEMEKLMEKVEELTEAKAAIPAPAKKRGKPKNEPDNSLPNSA